MPETAANAYEFEVERPDGLSTPPHPGQRFPFIVFLHGAGERGGDKAAQVKKHGPWKGRPLNAAVKARLGPYFVIGPHLPGAAWEVARVLQTLRAAFDQLRAESGGAMLDVERAYVTGVSLGGPAALDLAASGFPNPEIAPCSLADEHRRAFRGAVLVCPLAGSAAPLRPGTTYQFFDREHDWNPPTRNTYPVLRNQPPHSRFHVYEGFNHNCWTRTYGNPSLYDWLDDPAAQPNWGGACDFGMCVEGVERTVQIRPARNGQPALEAPFCGAHARDANQWLYYARKIGEIP